MQSIIVGKVQGQELAAAGHATSAVRKQRAMNAGTQLTLPFYSVQDPAHRVALPTFRVCLLSSTKSFLDTSSQIGS